MKGRSDFELELPSSLRQIVMDEINAGNLDDAKAGKEVQSIDDESIETLMTKVYVHIEKQALEVFKSNEPWALKAWAYSTILKDTVASEATQHMVEEMMSPVVEWQNQQAFDPVSYYRDKLVNMERKSRKTVNCYMVTACRFVAKMGRKRHYTDEDVEQYLSYISKYYQNPKSYAQDCIRLKQFLRRLPGADKNRELPIDIPRTDNEFRQPTLSYEDIETLAWATVIDPIPANMVVRLAIASIYGARRSELTEISTQDIQLDGSKDSTIYIRTKKGGQRKPQPIPEPLVDLFKVPISQIREEKLQRELQKICKRAQVQLPFWGGFHSFRRRVATTLSEIEHSEINVSNFMRWATPRQYSMLARYRQTPVEEGDKAILNKHPMVQLWAEVAPYVLKFNPDYSSLNDNLH